ncbi:MAG TPA: hypothetical protein PLN89_10345, partial [Elusimicrobiota bacterium]|nr:hypothetical protein [Elusimicrobiota bacterium]
MVNPLARRLILFGVLAAALFPPRARAEDVSVSSSTTPTEPAYVYKGDRMRDPFIPLNGQGGATMDSAIAKVDMGPFNPAGAELKGILKTPT